MHNGKRGERSRRRQEAQLPAGERARREQIREAAAAWEDPGWGWQNFWGPDVDGLAEKAIAEGRSVESFRLELRRLKAGEGMR